jgi:hypothetical protein
LPLDFARTIPLGYFQRNRNNKLPTLTGVVPYAPASGEQQRKPYERVVNVHELAIVVHVELKYVMPVGVMYVDVPDACPIVSGLPLLSYGASPPV